MTNEEIRKKICEMIKEKIEENYKDDLLERIQMDIDISDIDYLYSDIDYFDSDCGYVNTLRVTGFEILETSEEFKKYVDNLVGLYEENNDIDFQKIEEEIQTLSLDDYEKWTKFDVYLGAGYDYAGGSILEEFGEFGGEFKIKEDSLNKVYCSLVDVDSLVGPFLSYLFDVIKEEGKPIKNFEEVFYKFVEDYDDEERNYASGDGYVRPRRGSGLMHFIDRSNKIDVNDFDVIMPELFEDEEKVIRNNPNIFSAENLEELKKTQISEKEIIIDEVREEFLKGFSDDELERVGLWELTYEGIEEDAYDVVCSAFDKLFEKIKKLPSSEILKYIEYDFNDLVDFFGDKLGDKDVKALPAWYEDWASSFGISSEELKKYCSMLDEKRSRLRTSDNLKKEEEKTSNNSLLNTNNNFGSSSPIKTYSVKDLVKTELEEWNKEGEKTGYYSGIKAMKIIGKLFEIKENRYKSADDIINELPEVFKVKLFDEIKKIKEGSIDDKAANLLNSLIAYLVKDGRLNKEDIKKTVDKLLKMQHKYELNNLSKMITSSVEFSIENSNGKGSR